MNKNNKKNTTKDALTASKQAKSIKKETLKTKEAESKIRKTPLKTKEAVFTQDKKNKQLEVVNTKVAKKTTKSVAKDEVSIPNKKGIKKTKINGKEKDKLPPIIPKPEEPPSYGDNQVELDFGNEVYDEADIASALEMGFIAHALEAHKSKVAKETHPDFDGESCIDCGDEIPQLRLNMGRIRCVHCQEALERKNKLHGR